MKSSRSTNVPETTRDGWQSVWRNGSRLPTFANEAIVSRTFKITFRGTPVCVELRAPTEECLAAYAAEKPWLEHLKHHCADEDWLPAYALLVVNRDRSRDFSKMCDEIPHEVQVVRT